MDKWISEFETAVTSLGYRMFRSIDLMVDSEENHQFEMFCNL